MAESFEKLKQRWRAETDARRARSDHLRGIVRERCVSVFERFGVQKAVIFGSVAQGRVGARSDVDLLVLPLKNDVYWEFMHELEDVLERPVDLYTDRDDPAWVRKILERGEVVYDARSCAAKG